MRRGENEYRVRWTQEGELSFRFLDTRIPRSNYFEQKNINPLLIYSERGGKRGERWVDTLSPVAFFLLGRRGWKAVRVQPITCGVTNISRGRGAGERVRGAIWGEEREEVLYLRMSEAHSKRKI